MPPGCPTAASISCTCASSRAPPASRSGWSPKPGGCVRPGGFVAAQEADFATLSCFPPHPAWTTLVAAFRGCFPWTAEDPEAHRMYRLMRAAGLEDVGYRPVLVGVRAGDPWVDYLPATVESLRPSILARGLLTRAGAGRGARRLPRASGGAGHDLHRAHPGADLGPSCHAATEPSRSFRVGKRHLVA